MSFLFRLLPVPALLLFGSGSGVAAEISEKDYFTELPEVLTVTRLAQPLSETPGAVTIIDRETIRRSGARELVDVLRLVPGYLVGGGITAPIPLRPIMHRWTITVRAISS